MSAILEAMKNVSTLMTILKVIEVLELSNLTIMPHTVVKMTRWQCFTHHVFEGS